MQPHQTYFLIKLPFRLEHMDSCIGSVLVLLRERFQPQEGAEDREKGGGCQATG